MNRFFIVFCLLIQPWLFGDEQSNVVSAGDPRSIVEKHVSAITGQFVESRKDLVLGGKEPIYFMSHFISLYSALDNRKGWKVMPHLYAEFYRAGSVGIHIFDETGTAVIFKPYQNADGSVDFRARGTRGMTNTSRGEPSGQTNILNARIQIFYKLHQLRLYLGDGTEKWYGLRHSHKDFQGREGFRYCLQKEKKRNGNWVYYSYNPQHCLSRITVKSPTGNRDYGAVNFQFQEPSMASNCKIKNSQGKTFCYEFRELSNRKRKCTQRILESVKSPYLANQSYYWCQDKKKGHYNPVGLEFFANRVIEFDYFHGEISSGNRYKLQAIKAPVGTNGEKVTTHLFNYQLGSIRDNKVTANSMTIVKDAYGYETRYIYTPFFQFKGIEHYWGEKEHQHLAYSEQFVWDPQYDLNYLKGKVICHGADRQGEIATKYEYDDRGNITCETKIGLFTGRYRHQFHFNGLDPDAHVEYHQTRKEYEPHANRLTKIIYPNGNFETFSYFYDTHLLERQLTYDRNGHVIGRQFYQYNLDNVLIGMIEDDGSKETIHDLTNVQRRLVTQIIPTDSNPGLDLPHIVDELYEDPTSRKLTRIRKTIYTYTCEGWVLSKQIYDANEVLCYTLQYRYDDHGNVIYETDAMGNEITRVFDAYNNMLSEKHLQKGIAYYMVYDNANRMIRKTEKTQLGSRTWHFQYDAMSRKIQETDYLGRETYFKYDSMGNLIEKRMIFSTSDPKGKFHIEKTVYDALRRPIIQEDSLGNRKRIHYNSFGDPIEEIDSKGNKTRIIYNIDQTIQRKIHPDGTQTVYDYDDLKRIIRIAKHDQADKRLSSKQYQFVRSLLKKEIDELGVITEYFYDYAGRVIKKRLGNKTIEYTYDALDHISEEVQIAGDEKVSKCTIFDFLDRPIEKKTITNGQVVDHQKFYYDAHGNVVKKHTFSKTHLIVEQFEYDAFNRLVKQIDPSGNETHIQYDEIDMSVEQMQFRPGESRIRKMLKKKFPEKYCRHCLSKWERKTTISPKGLKTVEIFNEACLLVSLEQFDPLDLQVQKEEYDYDAEFRCIKQLSSVLFDGEVIDTFEVSRAYDSEGNLTELREGAPARVTRMTYTFDQQLQTVEKMSGVKLFYFYDVNRRMSEVSSSDHSVHYQYAYDLKGRLIQVVHPQTKRIESYSYDDDDNMIEEKLANGLTIQNTYDAMGRRSRLTLPDQSLINYHYDGVFLKGIERKGYFHTYEEYDPTGAVLRERTMFGDVVDYAIDHHGRRVYVSHPNMTHRYKEFDAEGLLTKANVEFASGSYERTYTYNALHQLIDETGPTSCQKTYDSHYSPRTKNGSPIQLNATHQITSYRDLHIEYDPNGNRKAVYEGTKKTLYEYDALDRLSCVQTDRLHIVYIYDSENRCIEKIVQEEGELTHQRFIYDGLFDIGSYINEELCELRVLGDTSFGDIGSSVLFELNQEMYTPLHDLSGNVALLLAISGEEEQKMFISGFGEVLFLDENDFETESLFDNPWIVQSKRKDPHTGLINFGQRFYDSHLGVFINPDPKGLDTIPNPYTYLYNSPFRGRDVLGLFFFPENPYTFPDNPYLESQKKHSQEVFPRNFESPSQSPSIREVDYQTLTHRQLIEGLSGTEMLFGLWYTGAKSLTAAMLRNGNISFAYEFADCFDPTNGYLSFINGVGNTPGVAFSHAQYLSETFNHMNIHGVYNASRGFVVDIMEAGLQLKAQMKTDASYILYQNIIDGFATLPPKAHMLLIPHSQGAIIVDQCLDLLPEALRQRIEIIAVAPAKFIHESKCYHVEHLVNIFDPVTYVDWPGRITSKSITIVNTPNLISKFDHTFQSEVYKPYLKGGVQDYLDRMKNL